MKDGKPCLRCRRVDRQGVRPKIKGRKPFSKTGTRISEREGLVGLGGLDMAAPLGYAYNQMKFPNALHQLYVWISWKGVENEANTEHCG